MSSSKETQPLSELKSQNKLISLPDETKDYMRCLLLKTINDIGEFVTYDRLNRMVSSLTWEENVENISFQYELSINQKNTDKISATLSISSPIFTSDPGAHGSFPEYCQGSLLEVSATDGASFFPINEDMNLKNL